MFFHDHLPLGKITDHNGSLNRFVYDEMLYAESPVVCCASALKHAGTPGSSVDTRETLCDSDLASSGCCLVVYYTTYGL